MQVPGAINSAHPSNPEYVLDHIPVAEVCSGLQLAVITLVNLGFVGFADEQGLQDQSTCGKNWLANHPSIGTATLVYLLWCLSQIIAIIDWNCNPTMICLTLLYTVNL
jgi:hypothetical protein